jgi:putative transcriptional regulator
MRGVNMKTRLRELRARDRLNQSELAKLAKVSRQTISLIEREQYIPSLLIAKRMAIIFNEPIENIFIFDEEEL